METHIGVLLKADEPNKKVLISESLKGEQHELIQDLLREFSDVCSYSYKDMSGVDSTIAQYSLNVQPNAKSIKQRRR